MFEALSNLKALNAAPFRARYTGACEKGERDEDREPARLTRAPAHRKLESQFVFWDAPREGCACERADPPRGACFPSEQGLEHSLWFSSPRMSAVRPPRGGATEAEKIAILVATRTHTG